MNTSRKKHSARARSHVSTSLRGALLSAEARLRAKADATKQSTLRLLHLRHQWIASRSLSSGAHSRDPLARNDAVGCGEIAKSCTINSLLPRALARGGEGRAGGGASTHSVKE